MICAIQLLKICSVCLPSAFLSGFFFNFSSSFNPVFFFLLCSVLCVCSVVFLCVPWRLCSFLLLPVLSDNLASFCVVCFVSRRFFFFSLLPRYLFSLCLSCRPCFLPLSAFPLPTPTPTPTPTHTMAHHNPGGQSSINYEEAGHRLEDLPSNVSFPPCVHGSGC